MALRLSSNLLLPFDDASRILESNLFDVLISILDLMGKVEEYLFRSTGGKFLNSNLVKEVEAELVVLKQKVATIALTKKTVGVENCVNVVKEDLSGVKERVEDVEGDLSNVKEDAGAVKERISAVEGDVSNVKEDACVL